MKTVYILLIIIASLLLSIFLLYYTEKNSRNILPSQISKTFDPKINSVVLIIKGITDDYSTLDVEVAFPVEFFKEKSFETMIACSDEDLRIVYSEENNVVADRTLFFDTISSNEYETILLTGLCRDDRCETIDKGCRLIVN